MSRLLSVEEVDRLASKAGGWRRASDSECLSAGKSVGYVGNVDGVDIGVYWAGGIFRDSYLIIVSSDGFTAGYSWGLPRKQVKEHFDRVDSEFNARLSRAEEQALEKARRLSA